MSVLLSHMTKTHHAWRCLMSTWVGTPLTTNFFNTFSSKFLCYCGFLNTFYWWNCIIQNDQWDLAKSSSTQSVYPLWPDDNIWLYNFGSTLTLVMACCPIALIHFLSQCWLLNKATSPRGQWVNDDMFILGIYQLSVLCLPGIYVMDTWCQSAW